MRFYSFLFSFIIPFLLFAEYEETINYKNGCRAIITKNDKGQMIQKKIKGENLPDGNLSNILLLENLKYDDRGNLLEVKDCFYRDEKLKIQITCFSYNKENQITSIIRGFKSKNERKTIFEYDQDGDLSLRTTPDGVKIHYIYDPDGNLIIKSSDNTIHYIISYDDQGYFIKAEDRINNQIIKREIDKVRNFKKETFLNGEKIEIYYHKKHKPKIIKINNIGEIHYEYDDFDNLLKVKRTSNLGKELYSHTYLYDENNEDVIEENLIADLGQVFYDYDKENRSVTISSPYSFEKCFLDSFGNVTYRQLDDKELSYEYDNLFRLVQKDNYDLLYNPINAKINNLNELLEYNGISCRYDLNGNLIEIDTEENLRYSFKYDALNRLIEAKKENLKVSFTYSPFGRRLSKTVYQNGKEILKETYLYFENNEIASFENGILKAFRIPGSSFHKDFIKEVAMELNDQIYCPIHDVRENISKLVEIKNKEIFDIGTIDPFGENLEKIFKNKYSPWLFSSKRYDKETNLIYFGHRYFSPLLKRWITSDPRWFVNGINLYTYALNNPFRYIDPPGSSFYRKSHSDAIAGGLAAWGIYKASEKSKEKNKGNSKKSKPHTSGKEGSKDAPSWAKGNKPYEHESGKDFAIFL